MSNHISKGAEFLLTDLAIAIEIRLLDLLCGKGGELDCPDVHEQVLKSSPSDTKPSPSRSNNLPDFIYEWPLLPVYGIFLILFGHKCLKLLSVEDTVAVRVVTPDDHFDEMCKLFQPLVNEELKELRCR